MMNPVVTVAVVVTLVLFTGLFAAISLVGFFPEDVLGSEGQGRTGVSRGGRPG